MWILPWNSCSSTCQTPNNHLLRHTTHLTVITASISIVVIINVSICFMIITKLPPAHPTEQPSRQSWQEWPGPPPCVRSHCSNHWNCLDLATTSSAVAFLRVLPTRPPLVPVFFGLGGTTLWHQRYKKKLKQSSHLVDKRVFLSCPRLCSSAIYSICGRSPYVWHRASFRGFCSRASLPWLRQSWLLGSPTISQCVSWQVISWLCWGLCRLSEELRSAFLLDILSLHTHLVNAWAEGSKLETVPLNKTSYVCRHLLSMVVDLRGSVAWNNNNCHVMYTI